MIADYCRVHELKPQLYGLDPETELKDVGVVLRVSDLAAKLESLYCEHMTAEFMHIKVAFTFPFKFYNNGRKFFKIVPFLNSSAYRRIDFK